MNPIRAQIIKDLAVALAKILPTGVTADLLNATVGADAHPELSDAEVALVDCFFGRLCAALPEAVEAAINPPAGK